MLLRLIDRIIGIDQIIADDGADLGLDVRVRRVPVDDVGRAEGFEARRVARRRDGDDGAEFGHAREGDAEFARLRSAADDQDGLAGVIGVLAETGERRCEAELVRVEEGDEARDGVDGQRGRVVEAELAGYLDAMLGAEKGVFLQAS